ncbi:16S rRNA (cytosine(967)-C(5))-methyltransferase RsmB [Nitrincola alkalisediminis]|uniref:16S rRNA (cytosine(967)-C(5))-methyltransferase RsmB n=1 Tax=Nitrincola alkalisediminis TaxID=1366656 RepID=UPI00187702C0|nr:16S rRNA (cytosine(967)-C(5))-methyltransferase RsmB [Nitrincola alkalisediminis]
MKNVREAAAIVISHLIQQQGSLSTLLSDQFEAIPERDKALLQQLCYGTARDYYRLYALAGQFLKQPCDQTDTDVLALVLLGLYQLRDMRIPAHAAISETVSAISALGKPWAKGLINAILRRYQREGADIEKTLALNDASYQFNHPTWMIEKLRHNWPEHWQSLLQNNDVKGPLCLRINALRSSMDQWDAQAQAHSIAYQSGRFSEHAIYLEEATDVHLIPGFDEGLLSIQDEAAQLASPLLMLAPGQRVLDACAAPGGKLCHLLESEAELSDVIALELNEGRIDRIYQNLERLGLQTRCQVLQADASSLDWWDGQLFDRILLDTPCSGTGVIRRNPDIKILRQNENILHLAKLQLDILENLWQVLKVDGVLVYATCSVFPQENERIIERFCKLHSDAHHDPIEAEWGIERPYGRQLFPQTAGHDGFFYARLIKKA